MADSRQTIYIEGKEKMCIQGALKVDDFDQNTILLETVLGDMQIKGADLHIEELLLDEEKLSLSGSIQSVSFVETKATKRKRSGGFAARLTR
jgi:sporulation protein YabP